MNAPIYRRMFHHASCGLIVLDAEGELFDINPRALELLGCSPPEGREEEDPQSAFGTEELLHRFNAEARQTVQQALERGEEVHGETVVECEGIEARPLRYMVAPCGSAGEQPGGHFMVLQDISRELRIRSQREQRQNRYRALFEASSDPIIFVDTRGIINELNASALELLDATEAEQVEGHHLLRFVAPGSLRQAKRTLVKLASSRDDALHTEEVTLAGSESEVLVDARIKRFVEGERHSGYIINLRDIRHDREVVESLRENIDTYKALLREIHHRIKNNLSLIISLINLRSADFTDSETTALLEELKNRIMSITLLHEKLYSGDSFTSVYLPDYLSALAEHVLKTLHAAGRVPIKLSYDFQDAECPHDVAVPLGLIVTELITNAVKYAFPEGRTRGEISLALRRNGECLVLTVKDDGTGMPHDHSPGESATLGYKLIETLTKQISGELHLANDNGTAVRLTFPNTRPTS